MFPTEGREIIEIVEIVGIIRIVKISLNSPKLTTNRSCSWYLVIRLWGERGGKECGCLSHREKH